MSQNIILLTGELEFEHLSKFLKDLDPHLNLFFASTHAELDQIVENLSDDMLARTRLIAFCVNVIVKPHILQKITHNSYNFHPAPPNYPGSYAAQFAFHEKATEYGVTFHELTEDIDEGKIIDVITFDLQDITSPTQIETRAYIELFNLFSRLAHDIIQVKRPIRAKVNVPWSGIKRHKKDWLALSSHQK